MLIFPSRSLSLCFFSAADTWPRLTWRTPPSGCEPASELQSSQCWASLCIKLSSSNDDQLQEACICSPLSWGKNSPTQSFPLKRKLVESWWIVIFYTSDPTCIHATIFLFRSFDLNPCSYIKCLAHQPQSIAHTVVDSLVLNDTSVFPQISISRCDLLSGGPSGGTGGWVRFVYKCKYYRGITYSFSEVKAVQNSYTNWRCTETKPFLTRIGHLRFEHVSAVIIY